MKIAAYARGFPQVSDGIGVSVPDQIGAIRVWAWSHNHVLVRMYEDIGASGVDESRQGLKEMILDALSEPRPFESIVVVAYSKFFRDLDLFIHYQNVLKEKGIKLISITQPEYDEKERLEESRYIKDAINVMDSSQAKKTSK